MYRCGKAIHVSRREDKAFKQVLGMPPGGFRRNVVEVQQNTTFPGGSQQSGSYPETGFAEINGDFLEDDFCCSSRSSDCLHGSGQRQTQVLRIEGDTISWRAFLKATAFRERTGIDDIKTELIQ